MAMLTDREVLTAPQAVCMPLAVGHPAWPRWGPAVLRVVIFILADIGALMGAASLGYLLWAEPVRGQPAALYVDLIPLLLLFPLGYAGAGLYPGFGVGAVETLRRLFFCTSFAFLVIATTLFVLQFPSPYSRLTVAFAWGASLIFVPLCRFLLLWGITQWQWWREPAILVGDESWEQGVVQSLRSALSLGYHPIGIITSEPEWREQSCQNIPVLGGMPLVPFLTAQGIRVALLREREGNAQTLRYLQEHFHHVVLIQEYTDLPVERVRVCNVGGMLGIEFTNDLLCWHNRFLKRSLDVVLGGLLFLGGAVLIGVGAIWVKCSSRGPAFFAQEREGLRGHPFRVWKLRTMYQDAERRLEEFLSTNPELRREWEAHYNLIHDPRVVLGGGAFLRRFSLDELPQLWSVVKGEMSLVGPRPLPEYHLKQFPQEFRELRRRLRPRISSDRNHCVGTRVA